MAWDVEKYQSSDFWVILASLGPNVVGLHLFESFLRQFHFNVKDKLKNNSKCQVMFNQVQCTCNYNIDFPQYKKEMGDIQTCTNIMTVCYKKYISRI